MNGAPATPQSKQANSYANASAGAVFDNYVGIFVDGNWQEQGAICI